MRHLGIPYGTMFVLAGITPLLLRISKLQQVMPTHSRMETFSKSIHCTNDRFFCWEQMFARRDLPDPYF